LRKIAGCGDNHACLLLAGSADIAIEATLGSFCPARRKKTLVIINGRCGEKAAEILERIGRPVVRLTYRESSVPKASDVTTALLEDRNISHVVMALCETSTGMLNPVAEIAATVREQGRLMILDATVGFGSISLDMEALGVDILVTVSGTSLEAVPGLGILIAPEALLAASQGESHSAGLDLYGYWTGKPGPLPPHLVAALREALRAIDAEGGVEARAKRYHAFASGLRERMMALGFTLLLPEKDVSDFVQTVLAPRAATFSFQRFQAEMRERGFLISEGVLEKNLSFRIGTMGQIGDKLLPQVMEALEDVMSVMDVRNLTPVPA
jgi:2-aminoethylphosphonate-pyruvate transaminase